MRKAFFAALVSAALLSASDASVAADATVLTAIVVEPVVVMEKGQIHACGMKAVTETTQGSSEAVMKIVKDAATEKGKRFDLEGRWRDGRGNQLQIVALSLSTASTSTAGKFSAPTANGGGAFVASGTFDEYEGGNLFRELSLSGGTVSMDSADGARLIFNIPGPLLPSVRSAYLNCAGDLFRP